MARSRWHRAVPVVLLAAALVASSCSSDDGAASPVTTRAPVTSTTAATTTTIAPLTPSTVATPAGATVTQPAQPTSGPGSSALPHRDWTVSEGGEGADAWYVFEPADPEPATAPLSIIVHGYYEYEGYDSMYELIRHTVLAGNVVIYPRWQTDIATPCPGPVDIEPCLASTVAGIKGALAFLHADPTRVQPDLDHTSWFGFSFGGIITIDLANRYQAFDLPEPRAIFLDDPHDGGLTGTDEPAVDRPLDGIPSTVRLQCHVGAQGVIAEPRTADGSCNAIFPLLTTIPAENKDLVLTEPDDHGQPALTALHGVCAARKGQADAYDWNFCWKVWDVLRDDEATAAERRIAHGNTAAHTNNGSWSDGTPIAPLRVQAAAPIRP